MTLTEKAQEQISQTLTAGYLRVAVDGGGCSGYRIVLSKATELSLGDQLVSDNVISDATSLALLTEVEMDYSRDPFAPSYIFNMPHTRSGCGSSFTL